MRILVVGAGATGGFLAARFIEAGLEVSVLARARRAAELATTGLRIRTPSGSGRFAATLIASTGDADPIDVIFLAVRGDGIGAALGDIARFVGQETMIAPLANGMRHVDAIRDAYGSARFVGCVLKVAAMLSDDGAVVQLTPQCELAYGEWGGGVSSRLEALHKTLTIADVGARLSADIALDMWEKWVFLATIGASTCLMRAPVGEIAAVPKGVTFLHAMLDEACSVAGALGRASRSTFRAETRARLDDSTSKQTSSMYRDLIQGKPTEFEQIIGDMIARGQSAGLTLPLLDTAYTALAVHQRHALGRTDLCKPLAGKDLARTGP